MKRHAATFWSVRDSADSNTAGNGDYIALRCPLQAMCAAANVRALATFLPFFPTAQHRPVPLASQVRGPILCQHPLLLTLVTLSTPSVLCTHHSRCAQVDEVRDLILRHFNASPQQYQVGGGCWGWGMGGGGGGEWG